MKQISGCNFKVGDYLMHSSYTGIIHQIVEIYNPPRLHSFGQPSVCRITWKNMVDQNISYQVLQEFFIVSKEDDPEYFI
jgi:hypothetical protein